MDHDLRGDTWRRDGNRRIVVHVASSHTPSPDNADDLPSSPPPCPCRNPFAQSRRSPSRLPQADPAYGTTERRRRDPTTTGDNHDHDPADIDDHLDDHDPADINDHDTWTRFR